MKYKNFALGAIPSPHDPRDYTIDKFEVASLSSLPSEYIIPYVPEIYDQGQYAQCVAFALAGIKESQEWKERGVKKRYSHSFIYANREITDHQGEGMIPRQALKRLVKFGCCEYDDFPVLNTYPVCKAQFEQKINQLLPLALPQKVYAYVRLRTIEEIKQFLYTFQTPVAIGINVYESFLNTGNNGIVSPPSGTNYGGHMMIIVGWRIIANTLYFIILNSWGKKWGDNGLCYMNFNEYKFSECWGVVDQKPEQEINKATEILLTIGNNKIIVDNKVIEMDTAPFYKDGRTFVPVRFVAEALGYKVKWYNINPSGENGDMILITNGGERNWDEILEMVNELS